MSSTTSPGIHFPASGDGRPTTETTRGILADAVVGVDADLAGRIAATRSWRKDYVDHVRDVTAASAASPEAARQIAADGLASMRRRLVLVDADGLDTPLEEIDLGRSADGGGHSTRRGRGRFTPFATETVTGTGAPVTELTVPYEGRELTGSALLAQLDRWVDAGVVEPSFGAAVREVVAHPEWLALPNRQVALIGAGSEMGPVSYTHLTLPTNREV